MVFEKFNSSFDWIFPLSPMYFPEIIAMFFPFSNENFVFDNEKIKKKLGVKFFPLLAGLKRDWEKHYKVVC